MCPLVYFLFFFFLASGRGCHASYLFDLPGPYGHYQITFAADIRSGDTFAPLFSFSYVSFSTFMCAKRNRG